MAKGDTNAPPLHYQWQFNGTNIAHATISSLTWLPTDSGVYSVIISNAAGSARADWHFFYEGSAWAWGGNSFGESVAPALTNVSAIAAGKNHCLAALDDGSVMAWGGNANGQTNIPPGLSNVIAVAAGDAHSLALRADGSVAAWGDNACRQTAVPATVRNALAIAAGGNQSLALLQNGTVVQWGRTNAPIPGGLNGVKAIACGANFCMALRGDSTVIAWGANDHGQTKVPSRLNNVVAIACGDFHALALKADGAVVAWGDNSSGQARPPARLKNVLAIAAGSRHSLALINDGSVIAWGDGSSGRTNVSALTGVKFIAAAGNHNVAAIFSPRVQYPVNAAGDLLLIYNTNSPDSIRVLNYYIANRPMIGRANVVPIAYANRALVPALTDHCDVPAPYHTNYCEVISPANLTNLILAPLRSWLAAHPTKRPQYVVLFPDVPTKVNTNTYFPTCGHYPAFGVHESVQCQIHDGCAAGWNPFVTSINMPADDCIGYINKLKDFGARYSPGKLIISASAGGYGDTSYCFDDGSARLFGFGDSSAETVRLLEKQDIARANIAYARSTNRPFLSEAANVAGFWSWATHGHFYPGFAVDGELKFHGASGWYLMATGESFNGRQYETDQSTYLSWFAPNAFGGANYSNTPVGAVTCVDEPTVGGLEELATYFGMWGHGKNFGMCAWVGRQTLRFQAIGDPFVAR